MPFWLEPLIVCLVCDIVRLLFRFLWGMASRIFFLFGNGGIFRLIWIIMIEKLVDDLCSNHWDTPITILQHTLSRRVFYTICMSSPSFLSINLEACKIRNSIKNILIKNTYLKTKLSVALHLRRWKPGKILQLFKMISESGLIKHSSS